MTNTTIANVLYPVANAGASSNPFVDVFSTRNPTSNDVAYPVQKKWFNTATQDYWILEGFISSNGIVSANWQMIGAGVSVPTTFTTNSGTAIPSSNNLDIFGATVVASASPVATTGATNVVTINVQAASAQASSSATNMGLASFNSADFTVDANGYVTFSGTGTTETLTGNSGGAVSPTAGNINTVGAGSITIVGNPGTSTLTTQLTGLTNHNVLIGAGTTTITKVAPSATSGVPLISQGASSDPVFGTAVVAGGGTGDTSFTAYAPVCGGTSTTGALQSASTGISTSGFVLTSTGASSLPTFQAVSASGAVTTIDGDSGSATPSAGVITISGGSTGLTTSASGSTVDLTGTLNLANGGTSASLTASNGGIFYSTASAGAILAGTATARQMLQSGSSTAPAWSTATWPATTTINQILYSSSANTVAGLATTNNAVLTTNATGVPTWEAVTDGQIIIGSSAGAPAAATITAGTGITVANGHNTITISASGSGFTWNDVTGGSATLAAENGYIADSGSLTTFTMPTNNSFGDTIKIVGKGAGGWKIVYGALQNIILGSSTSTTTTGNIASTNAHDCVELVCTTASITAPIFTVVSSMGNITIA